jgi:hypothetical protein
MNQRGSHFQLGSTSQNYQSVYHKDYDKKQAQNNHVNVSNPFRGGSLSHNDKGYFTTTNKVLMKAWDNAEVAKLDDAKLKELRTHHFKLGTYNPHEAVTTNKLYHDRKHISGEASKNQEESKNKMRGHNHDFKEVTIPICSKTTLTIDQPIQVSLPPKKCRGKGQSSRDREKMLFALEHKLCLC